MKRLFFFSLWVAAITGSTWAGEKALGIRDVLSLKRIRSVAWTPDSESVIFSVQVWQEKENRLVTHFHRAFVADGKVIQLTRGDKGESRGKVSPNGRFLAFLAERGVDKQGSQKARAQLWVLPLDGGEAFQVTEVETGVEEFDWSPATDELLYTARDVPEDQETRKKNKEEKRDAVVVDRDFRWTHLWRIGLEERKAKRLTQGALNVTRPAWSGDGEWIAFVATYAPFQESSWKHIDDEQETDLMLLSVDGKEMENLTPEHGRVAEPRWKGKSIGFSISEGLDLSSRWDLAVIDTQSRELKLLTRSLADSVATGGFWDPPGTRLFFSQGRGLYTHVFGVNIADLSIRQITRDQGIDGSLYQLSPDGRRIAGVLNLPNRPGNLWVIEVEQPGRRRLTDLNPGFGDFAVAETREVRWRSSDGLEIEGILTLPLHYREGVRVPLILQIHGGPTGRFTRTFNGRNSQIWAAHGYAVLQPNPRGSTGYGQGFIEANRNDWGGRDFHLDDLAGVEHVVAMGIADPERLVVMGGSYGGFSTFWAVTQTDRFKAAIAHAAISDWYSFYGQTDIPQYLKWGFGGHSWERKGVYRRFSPVDFVEAVQTPIMITHGEQDHRVPITQAEQFYTALKKLGREVEFVRYPREGHGIREPNHRIDLFERQLTWFDRHLGMQREPAGDPAKPSGD